MPVTPGFLGIDEPSAIDKRADTNVVTRAAVVVHREVISIGSADASTPEQIAGVTATNALKVDPSAVQSPVISTDAAGVNQQAITAAGDAKITLDGEQVAISNFPATQPISAAALPLPTNASTEATLALIKAKTDNLDVPLSAGTAHVRIDNQLAVTGPSGTALATFAAQTDGTQKTKLVDTGGVNVAKVTLGGNLQVSLVASSATVSTVGQETENTAPVNSKNAVLSAKANAANPAWTEGAYVPASVDLSGHLRVDRSAVQPISDNAGSLTVDAPVATPIAARLSDGAAFLTTSGGRLAVDASGVAVPITDNAGSLTVDAPVGTPIAARLSDGAAFYDGAKTGQLPAALVGGRLDTNNGSWLGSTAPSVGSKTSANSIPVVIASDQGSVAVTPAANSAINVAQIAGTATITAAAGVQKVGVVGGAGASLETTAGVIDDNFKNIGNVAVSVNKGIAGTGVQRIVVSEELQYRAATVNNVVAAAGTLAFFAITGSGTKTLRVRKVRVSGDSLTTLAVGSIECRKISSAPTAGTAVALTKVPMDSADAAATPTLCQVYTAGPTGGAALVGNLGCNRHMWKATTVADGANFSNVQWDFGSRGVVLRGSAEGLTLGFGAAPATAITLAVEVEWSEE